MQQTSLMAYHTLEKVGQKQKACMRVIRELGEACNQDIARTLKWEINRVTPRVKELRELNLVEESERRINPLTGRKVIYWREK